LNIQLKRNIIEHSTEKEYQTMLTSDVPS